MVEQWSTSEFESLVEEDQPVSLSRSSFVSKYQLKAENNGVLEVVVKRYDLSDSSLNYADLNKRSDLQQDSFPKPNSFYYRKEKEILNILGKYDIFPTLLGIIPDDLGIIMSDEPGVPLQSHFIDLQRMVQPMRIDEIESRIFTVEQEISVRNYNIRMNRWREKLLTHLSSFYNNISEFDEDIRGEIIATLWKDEKPKLFPVEFRTPWEEECRLRTYMYGFVGGLSLEYSELQPSTSKMTHTNNKRSVRSYLTTKGIDFNEFIRDWQNLFYTITLDTDNLLNDARPTFQRVSYLDIANDIEDSIMSGRLRTIHGDYGPHNVLVYEERRGKGMGDKVTDKIGKILDPNEMRVGPSLTDAVTGLFNIYCRPTESRIPRLFHDFFWKKSESIQEAYPNYHDMLAATMAMRILQNIRIASTNSTYTEEEIRRFVDGHPSYDDLPSRARQWMFKRDRVADLRLMLPYYAYGEGYNTVLAQSKHRDNVRKLCDLTWQLMSRTYIDVPYEKRYSGKRIDELGVNLVSITGEHHRLE